MLLDHFLCEKITCIITLFFQINQGINVKKRTMLESLLQEINELEVTLIKVI